MAFLYLYHRLGFGVFFFFLPLLLFPLFDRDSQLSCHDDKMTSRSKSIKKLHIF